MNSSNKLSLKQFIKMDSKQQQIDKNSKLPHPPSQSKNIKFQKNMLGKDNKKLKLNTLPCEQIQHGKDDNEAFLFRSTWQGDIQHFKQQMKILPGGCTSPTFATQILSHTNTNSNLFQGNDHINQEGLVHQRKNTMSNSRSKSKNNKSSKKFIGDNVSTYRPQKGMNETKLKQEKNIQSLEGKNEEQSYLYELTKLESMNHELKRQNTKIQQKYEKIREKYQKLEQEKDEKISNCVQSSLMSNEQLLSRMKSQSFWKFYVKAQKLIRSSWIQNNNQQSSNVINFMKELQALRSLSSEMKKQNKVIKKDLQCKSQQIESAKDKLSVQQVQIQQMRLKCAAYENSIKKLHDQIKRNQCELQKLAQLQQLEQKLLSMTNQSHKLSTKLTSVQQQLQEKQIINQQCQKQRLTLKKRYQYQQQQLNSLNKQLSSLKTSYNLLQIQRQQMSTNKKQLIQKQKLKQKIYQMQKQLKNILRQKQNQINKIKQDYEIKLNKEIEIINDSRTKQIDNKVLEIINNMKSLEKQNHEYQKKNLQYSQINCKLQKTVNQLQLINQQKEQQLTRNKKQNSVQLKQLSRSLAQLNQRLKNQNQSIQKQSISIKQLQDSIREKQQIIKQKQLQSQQLKQSLVMIQQQNESKNNSRIHQNSDKSSVNKNISEKYQHQDNQDIKYKMLNQELEDYIGKLQDKHNQALDMYEKIYNQKVQLEMQLQCAHQNPTLNLKQENLNSKLNKKFANGNQNKHNIKYVHQHSQSSNEEQLQICNESFINILQSLLSIKQQIIKKILVFCPLQFKQLMIEYIYYGDMIKQKYFQILQNQANLHLQTPSSQNNRQFGKQSRQNSSDEDQAPKNHKNRTINIRNHKKNTNNSDINQSSFYNKTRNYKRKQNFQESQYSESEEGNHWQQQNDDILNQGQINELMEKFVKIGLLIEQETRESYKITRKSKGSKSKYYRDINTSSKQKESQRSKEKYNKESNRINYQQTRFQKNLSQQNQNHFNSINYKPSSKRLQIVQNAYSQNVQNEMPSGKQRRRPLQLISEQKSNIFDNNCKSNNTKFYNQNQYQDQNYSNRPHLYQEQPRITLRSQNSRQCQQQSMRNIENSIQQTPYQKKKMVNKTNFNHGIINNLNLMKMMDKIRHQ